MGDRIWHYEDCPNCGGKNTLECYTQDSAFTKGDSCEQCGYYQGYTYHETDNGITITVDKPRIPNKEQPMTNHSKDIAGSELREAIVNYRVKCDAAWSERNDGVYSQEDYEKAIQWELDKVLALIAQREAAAIQAFGEKLEKQAKTYRRYLITDEGTQLSPETTWAVPITAIQEALMPNTPTKDKGE